MRMPRTQFRLDSNRERRFLNAFVKLKQMWMTGARPNPDYFHQSFRRKSADAFEGKEKRAELDRTKFFPERELNGLGNIGKKTKSKV